MYLKTRQNVASHLISISVWELIPDGINFQNPFHFILSHHKNNRKIPKIDLNYLAYGLWPFSRHGKTLINLCGRLINQLHVRTYLPMFSHAESDSPQITVLLGNQLQAKLEMVDNKSIARNKSDKGIKGI